MYAVIRTGATQERVEQGQRLRVDLRPEQVGDQISFEALLIVDGETVLRDLYQAQPLRVLIPYRDRGDIFQAAIACVSGGLVGGDRLAIDVTLDDGCRATVIGQAAETKKEEEKIF